jgi:hypothetical protein
MATKTFRLKVKKVPLTDDIIYKRPNFPVFKELHLDLLENKVKLKKNPPKPIFVRSVVEDKKPSNRSSNNSSNHEEDDDEFTLEELEKTYNKYDSDREEIFSDVEEEEQEPVKTPEYKEKEKESREPERIEYKQEQFVQEEQIQEDEEEKEFKEKTELLYKFMILRKKYPNAEIQEFSEHSDLPTMKRVYEKLIRRVNLDSSVETYKKFLIGAIAVVEWVSTTWLGVNLSGFTASQIQSMNTYDSLLIELGEKHYTSLGSKLPVEVRLIGVILFNAALFYMQKMMLSGGGINILSSLFGGGQTMQQAQPPATQQPVRRRRNNMKGPTITPSEVEELTRRVESDKEKNSDTDTDKDD